MPEKGPNCLQCKNYFITYDAARPYGCRAMGFKSKTMPSQVVLNTSGMPCQLFTPKTSPAGGKPGSATTA